MCHASVHCAKRVRTASLFSFRKAVPLVLCVWTIWIQHNHLFILIHSIISFIYLFQTQKSIEKETVVSVKFFCRFYLAVCIWWLLNSKYAQMLSGVFPRVDKRRQLFDPERQTAFFSKSRKMTYFGALLALLKYFPTLTGSPLATRRLQNIKREFFHLPDFFTSDTFICLHFSYIWM